MCRCGVCVDGKVSSKLELQIRKSVCILTMNNAESLGWLEGYGLHA
jgi:hypothetical protein